MVKKLLIAILLIGPAEYGLSETLVRDVNDLPFSLVVAGPTGGGTTVLLKMPDVHEALDMTNEQLHDLDDALRVISWERRELFQNLVAGKVFEEPVDKATLRQLLDIFNSQCEKSLTEQILTSKQQRRLNQLLLQLQGVAAFQRENVADSLNLTLAQQDAVTAICDSARHVRRTLGEANSETLPLLSGAQRSRWQAMQGEPFAFAYLCQQTETAQKKQRITQFANTKSRSQLKETALSR